MAQAGQLTPEQAQRISFLLQNPEDPNAAVFSDPAVRQQASDMLTQHVRENIPNPQAEFMNMVKGPGLMQKNFTAGAEDSIYGLATLGMDAVIAVTPDGSGVQESLKDQRKAINNTRRAAEYEHQAFIETELGGELDGAAGFLTKEIPSFAGEAYPIMFAPMGLSTYWRTVGINGAIGATAAGALDKESQKDRKSVV